MDVATHQPIAILGAGSWGTALAIYLARLGQTVQLWAHQTEHVATLQRERANNRFLPGCAFPETLQVTAEMRTALLKVKDILIAVPSVGFHSTLIALKPLLTSQHRVLWVTKGLETQSGQLLHKVAIDILGDSIPLAVLSGPSFAKEVAAGLPTAVVVASHHKKFADDLSHRFNSHFFRVYLSADVTGVEVGGIVKNVIAIAVGISEGMGFGANARSALITRGLAEMVRLGMALGAKHDTFSGLACLGDLVLTCTDNQSRNRRFGLYLGQGKSREEAEHEIGQVVEGSQNVNLLLALAQQHHIEMPISEAVWKVLRKELTIKEAFISLLSREPKSEY